LKILAITHNYPHKDDPACGIFAARQLIGLKNEGADIIVVVPSAYAPNFINKYERYKLFRPRKLKVFAGIEPVEVRFLRPPGKRALLWDGASCYFRARRKIRLMHKQHPFDIIFARGFWMESDAAIRLGRYLNIPAAGVAIGSDVNMIPNISKKHHKHFIHIANSLDCVLSTGKNLADKIEAVSDHRVAVIGGVVDLDEFCLPDNKNTLRIEMGFSKKQLLLLFVGHLIKSKGIFELIRAVDFISRHISNFMLNICGQGDAIDDLKTMISHFGLQSKVNIIGNVDPGDMHKWYQISDLFVLPSYGEGMPNSLMEAMACGLPVIATAVGGIPYSVGTSGSAILVEPKNVNQIQKAMLKLMIDENLRKQMSQKARKVASMKFSIKKNSEKVMRILKDTIKPYKQRQML